MCQENWAQPSCCQLHESACLGLQFPEHRKPSTVVSPTLDITHTVLLLCTTFLEPATKQQVRVRRLPMSRVPLEVHGLQSGKAAIHVAGVPLRILTEAVLAGRWSVGRRHWK